MKINKNLGEVWGIEMEFSAIPAIDLQLVF